MSSVAPYLISSLINLLPQIAVLIGCIIYISRANGSAGAFLLIGKIISLFSFIGGAYIISTNLLGYMPMNHISNVMTIVQGAGFVGAVFICNWIYHDGSET